MRTVLVNGCFDVLHVQHVRFLTWARWQGDSLIVALNTDDSMRQIKREPFVPYAQRRELLLALACVGDVIPLDSTHVNAVLDRVRPAIYCKGSDHDKSKPSASRDFVLSYGGEVRYYDGEQVHSTELVKAWCKSLATCS